MPFTAEQRARLEAVKSACLGQELLIRCGSMGAIARLAEMHIEADRWTARLENPARPGDPPTEIEITCGLHQHVTPEYWHFPEIGERYYFDPAKIAEFRRQSGAAPESPVN